MCPRAGVTMHIETIINRVLVKYPLFGSIVAHTQFVGEASVETAGTDGEIIYYNPLFLSSLSREEQVFILAHAICHIAFHHIFRSEGKDSELWNIATDAVINALLKQDGLPLVKGVVDIPEAIAYDAEGFYQKLLEEKKEQQSDTKKEQKGNTKKESSQKGDEESTEKYHDVGHDTHSMWKQATLKKQREEQEKGEGNATNGLEEEKIENQDNLFDKMKRMFSRKKERQALHEKEKTEKTQELDEKKRQEEMQNRVQLGEREVFKQNRIERKRQLEELQNALARESLGHGDSTNSDVRTIANIGTSTPLLDWRMLLKEAVKYDVDWSYENVEIEDGIVTTYLEEIPRPETEIVLDTSGSIDEVLLRNFLRECKNILQTSKVKVGCFDTMFYGFTEIKNEADIDNLSFYGGGGTDFNVAVNAFTNRVENKIIFTDGCSTMPSKEVDVLWIVFGDTKISPKGGRVIYINQEQLEKLNSRGKTR